MTFFLGHLTIAFLSHDADVLIRSELMPIAPTLAQPLNGESTQQFISLPKGKKTAIVRLDKHRAFEAVIRAYDKEPVRLAVLAADGTPIEELKASGRNPSIKINNPGSYLVQLAKESEPELEFKKSTTPLTEGYFTVREVRLKKPPSGKVTYTLPHQDYVVMDTDNDVRYGWHNTLTFNPGDWDRYKRLKVYLEVDNQNTDLPEKQMKRVIKVYRGVDVTPANLVQAESLGKTVEQKNARTKRGAFKITLDYKCDFEGLYTDARRSVLLEAAEKWAERINNRLTPKTYSTTLSPSNPQVFAIPVPIYEHKTDLLVLACSEKLGTAGGSPWGITDVYEQEQGMAALSAINMNSNPPAAWTSATFLSATLHELGHALGMLGITQTGAGKLLPDVNNPTAFSGTNAKALNSGQNIPMVGYAHPGTAIDSIINDEVTYDLSAPTPMDWAILSDHGYSVTP